MSLDSMTAKVREVAEANLKLGYKVKFAMDTGDIIFWDGTESRPKISNDDGEADTVFTLKAETMKKLMDGTLDPTLAYMTGKLKVSGKVGVAMKIADLLDQ